MRRLAEAFVFASVAVTLHLAAFAKWPQSGAEAGGVGGEDIVSFQGATEQIETMVATWTRPPETQQSALQTPQIQQPARPLLPRSSVRMDDAPNAALKMAAIPAPEITEDPLPDTTTADPTPLSQPNPPPRLRPQSRPKPKPEPKPKPKAKVAEQQQSASAGATQQRAAGTGGKSDAGANGKAQANVGPGKQAKQLAIWGARIRSQVERRKRYPSGTRASGTVRLKVTVARDGRLQAVSVIRSSGHAVLDQAALSAVRRAGRFPKAPKQLGKPVYGFSLNITLKR